MYNKIFTTTVCFGWLSTTEITIYFLNPFYFLLPSFLINVVAAVKLVLKIRASPQYRAQCVDISRDRAHELTIDDDPWFWVPAAWQFRFRAESRIYREALPSEFSISRQLYVFHHLSAAFSRSALWQGWGNDDTGLHSFPMDSPLRRTRWNARPRKKKKKKSNVKFPRQRPSPLALRFMASH